MPAFYIVLQDKIPGVDAVGLEGRSLSACSRKLEELAQRRGVRSLMSFFSTSEEEVLGLLGTEDTGKVGIVPQELWYSAEEGVHTISALLSALESESSLENVKLVLELAEFRHVLEAAEARKVQWHLAIDY